ncbi:hypothetical protein D082_05060 [Synechocystis sp. PCC 6714]|nr:hypothetical protein D082_05060 [Synechocystis sp. PCC 6714]
MLYEYETPEKYQNTYFVPLRYLIYEGEHGHLIIAGVFEGEEVCTLNPNLDPLCIHLLEEKINGMANHQPDPNRN